MTLYLDVDGVLADFAGSAIRCFGRDPQEYYNLHPAPWMIFEWLEISRREFWGLIDSHGEGFWVNLKPYPWTQSLLKLLEDYFHDIFFLTAHADAPHCLSGKLKWLSHLMGENCADRVGFVRDKWRLANSGCVLLDDNHPNCRSFELHGGKSILFPQAWNALHLHDEPDSKLEYLEQQFALL